MTAPLPEGHITEEALNEIFDAPVPLYQRQPFGKRAQLLRLAADALDRAEPATVENLRLAHHLASWARELDRIATPDSICECGQPRRQCVCDKLAADHYLLTGDETRLIGLGWPRDVLEALDEGDVDPDELLTSDWRNAFQPRHSPVALRLQRM